jgi:hypothetical protein
MGPLGAHFRTGYSLSEREREIAVNVILAKLGSANPTNAHERAGKAAGLPTFFTDTREQIIYEMATCLANARWAPKGIFDRAVAALDHAGITDVITLMGFYTSVAMTLAFYDVPPMHLEWPAEAPQEKLRHSMCGNPCAMRVSQIQTRHLSLHEPQESIAHPVDADDDPSSSTSPPIA